jgi:signal transduction histidine kinase
MTHFSDDERRFRVRQMRNIILGFIALGGLIALAVGLTDLNEQQMGWVTHTYQARRRIGEISLAVARLQAGREDERAQLDREINDLARMTVDNPSQQARIAQLRELVAELPHGPRGDRAEALTASDRLLAEMQQEEDLLLKGRSRRLHDLQFSFYALLALTATTLCVLAGLIYSSLWNFTQDIIGSRKALQKANQGLERAVEERTRELTCANDELRRFTYSVSHDLRAPLLNIVGFTAELETVAKRLADILNTARGARPETIYPGTDTLVEQDLPEAIHFISASTRKIDGLIQAILQLSRQNNREFVPQLLDMRKLLHGITEYIHSLIERAAATIEIADPLPKIVCDRMVIEQVFSNLIENAVKFAQPGRAPVVRITGRRIHELAEFRVSDNGRGIIASDFERIFDLFRRSGPQDKPGEGIGLAHVRSSILRLGGSIKLESQLGIGSTFIVSIPAGIDDKVGRT